MFATSIMKKIRTFIYFIFISSICQGTDFKPWFGNEYEVELRALGVYQNYDDLAVSHKRDSKHVENDAFMTFSAAYPFRKFCCEFETTLADTRHQHGRLDNFRLTGRYQLLDEQEGDFLSVVVGLTVTQPLSRALHDISSFHHGHIEEENTLSFGKKYGDIGLKDYRYRWWNVFGIGLSDIGSPWMREYAAFEYRYEELHQFRAFINTLWGTGSEKLLRYCFIGYGHIAHRSVDIGLRYEYDSNGWGALSVQYARRVYASNFPENANLISLEYYFPFGSQSTCVY